MRNRTDFSFMRLSGSISSYGPRAKGQPRGRAGRRFDFGLSFGQTRVCRMAVAGESRDSTAFAGLRAKEDP